MKRCSVILVLLCLGVLVASGMFLPAQFPFLHCFWFSLGDYFLTTFVCRCRSFQAPSCLVRMAVPNPPPEASRAGAYLTFS